MDPESQDHRSTSQFGGSHHNKPTDFLEKGDGGVIVGECYRPESALL
jgi:hypothetical protein